MKIGLILALTLGLCVILAMGNLPAIAATPTPSATLRGIAPTQTSIYIYLHATPTALTVVPMAITLDFQADPLLTADLTINIYRYWNRDHLLDIVGSIGLALFVLGLLIKFIGRTTRTNN